MPKGATTLGGANAYARKLHNSPPFINPNPSSHNLLRRKPLSRRRFGLPVWRWWLLLLLLRVRDFDLDVERACPPFSARRIEVCWCSS